MNQFDYNFITSKDIDYVTGEEIPWTWDRFTDVWKQEQPTGRFDKSVEIACTLLAPYFRKKGRTLSGGRILSDDVRDLYQEACLTVYERIAKYNPELGTFGTYISKWIAGVAREIQNDGMSNNNIKKGYRIYNLEGMTSKSNDGGDSVPYELVDPGSAVEDIVSSKVRSRNNQLLTKMISSAMQENDDENVCYTNVAFFAKFLGGIENFPEAMQEELCREMEIG